MPAAAPPSPPLPEGLRADLVVVGAGPAGLLAAIAATERGDSVLICEKMRRAGLKLIASGGGRCNLTNTLERDDFMGRWGRTGRFMDPALRLHDQWALRSMFEAIGVQSHAPDGFRVWPKTHDARTVQQALVAEVERREASLLNHTEVRALQLVDGEVRGVDTDRGPIAARRVLVATGGMGYPALGSTGAGYELARQAGHRVVEVHPAMQPLFTRESWPARCTAFTLPKVSIRIDRRKARKVHVVGDVIFTRQGIAGPAVMNLAREVTPLLDDEGEVPLLLELTGGRSEHDWVQQLKSWRSELGAELTVAAAVESVLPPPFAVVMAELAGVDPEAPYVSLGGAERVELARVLAVTPLTVVGSDGWKRAMVTRGGVHLKEVDPDTLQSKRAAGLYFAGEVLDLDGPCGGFNLTWAFSSGLLAGQGAAKEPGRRPEVLFEGDRTRWTASG